MATRRKLALIIANGKEVNDLAALFDSIDFDIVDTHVNVRHDKDMHVIVRQFAEQINDGDLVLFYFFGQTCHIDGTNYFLPADEKPIKSEDDVPDFSVNAQHAFELLAERNQSYVTIFIIDTSKENEQHCAPFAPTPEAIPGPSVQFIGTAPESARNLFSELLLDHLGEENETVIDVFTHVKDRLHRESKRTQRATLVNQSKAHRDVYLNEVISFKVDLPPDAKWKSKGRTVVGGRLPGETLDDVHLPRGLHVTAKSTIFIADTGNHRILECQTNGETIRKVTGRNIDNGGARRLDQPSDMLYDGKSKKLILCDHGNYRVLRRNLKRNTYTRAVKGNTSCFGLAMDDEGAIYVSDRENHQVRRYSPDGKEVTVVAGGRGEGRRLHQLNRPTYIAVGADRSLYVSDSMNDRVVKWEKDAEKGVVVAGGHGKGKDLTQLYGPAGLVVDRSGTIYVADQWNDRVMRWCAGATQGEVIAGDKFMRGCDAHTLNAPEGIAFDRDGNLYVADSHNHRVQCFSIDKD